MTAERFAVCPHDTARGFEKWTLLNTFVNKHVGLGSKFHLYLDFAEFGRDLEDEHFVWAYLNPADYLKATGQLGYEAVARPIDRFDIAHVIAAGAAGERGSLAGIAGKRVAAVKGYLFHLVKHRLTSEGIPFDLVPAKSYAEVMTLVERGEAEYGVTYNEHFDALAPATREKFRVVDSVHPGVSHAVVAHRSVAAELRRSLAELLIGAPTRDDGRKVLDELKMHGFEPVPEAPFLTLRQVIESASS